jgi:hypothetical protein
MTAIPSGKMMRPIAGAFAEYVRSRLVSKLAAVRALREVFSEQHGSIANVPSMPRANYAVGQRLHQNAVFRTIWLVRDPVGLFHDLCTGDGSDSVIGCAEFDLRHGGRPARVRGFSDRA